MGKNNKPYTTESFKAKLIELGRTDIEVIGEYINSKTKIKVKCTKPECGYEWEGSPSSLLNGTGCPICHKKIVVSGINDVLTLYPELKNVLDLNQGVDFSKMGIGEKGSFFFICPDCGKRQKISLRNVIEKGFKCKICGSSNSLPNRFLRSILIFLEENKRIDYSDFEFNINNEKKFRYDGMLLIGDKKVVIEMQGRQHYINDGFFSDTEEIKENDIKKEQFAIKNGYEEIQINCLISDFDKISEDFINKTKHLFYITIEELKYCWKKCQTSLLKCICEDYNNGKSFKDIRNKYKISQDTIRRCLKKGEEIGLCNYSLNKKDSTPKSIKIYDKEGNFIKETISIMEACRFLEEKEGGVFIPSNIISVCIGKYKQYKGYKFKYANEDE